MRPRQRIARPPSDLASMKYCELSSLARRGLIPWCDVTRVIREQIIARGGNPDRYAHLEPFDGRYTRDD